MGRLRLVLILAVLLATIWTTWLAYAAWTAGDPIVVSRPQLLVAPIIVEGQLSGSAEGGRAVQVSHVYRGQELLGIPADEHAPVNLTLRVEGLMGEAEGRYILALTESTAAAGVYSVAPTPSSLFHRGGRAPIYPASESVRAQVRNALASSGE